MDTLLIGGWLISSVLSIAYALRGIQYDKAVLILKEAGEAIVAIADAAEDRFVYKEELEKVVKEVSDVLRAVK